MVTIKIHRGSHQIGGSITEIYAENTHIFVDFGSELNADPDNSTDAEMIGMMQHAKCDAVLFTHYHMAKYEAKNYLEVLKHLDISTTTYPEEKKE